MSLVSKLLQICREEIDKSCPERSIEIWINTKHLIRKASQELAKADNKEKKERATLKLLEAPELKMERRSILQMERRSILQKELGDMEEVKYRGAAVRCKVDTEQEDILQSIF